VACQDTQFDAWLGVDVGIGNQADVAMGIGEINSLPKVYLKSNFINICRSSVACSIT
jgi:hypothetical protein